MTLRNAFGSAGGRGRSQFAKIRSKRKTARTTIFRKGEIAFSSGRDPVGTGRRPLIAAEWTVSDDLWD